MDDRDYLPLADKRPTIEQLVIGRIAMDVEDMARLLADLGYGYVITNTLGGGENAHELATKYHPDQPPHAAVVIVMDGNGIESTYHEYRDHAGHSWCQGGTPREALREAILHTLGHLLELDTQHTADQSSAT